LAPPARATARFRSGFDLCAAQRRCIGLTGRNRAGNAALIRGVTAWRLVGRFRPQSPPCALRCSSTKCLLAGEKACGAPCVAIPCQPSGPLAVQVDRKPRQGHGPPRYGESAARVPASSRSQGIGGIAPRGSAACTNCVFQGDVPGWIMTTDDARCSTPTATV
jgi:hypothetical protein